MFEIFKLSKHVITVLEIFLDFVGWRLCRAHLGEVQPTWKTQHLPSIIEPFEPLWFIVLDLARCLCCNFGSQLPAQIEGQKMELEVPILFLQSAIGNLRSDDEVKRLIAVERMPRQD